MHKIHKSVAQPMKILGIFTAESLAIVLIIFCLSLFDIDFALVITLDTVVLLYLTKRSFSEPHFSNLQKAFLEKNNLTRARYKGGNTVNYEP